MPVGWELERSEVLEEAELLALLVRETNGSVLAFALCGSVADREAAVGFLKKRLPLPVLEFTLSAQRKNPVDLLRQAPAGQRICIFFYDVEEALPELTGFVNLQREAFAEVPHATVFWVREYGLREIAAKAPDFWSWRSGVFDVRSEQLRLAPAIMRSVEAEPLVFRDRGDLERRIGLYRGLMDEYSHQERPDERFLAILELRLAAALLMLTRLDEGEQWSRRALESSERLGLELEAALAYHLLGIAAEERYQLQEAEQWYRKALETFERLGLEQQSTSAQHQLANLALQRGRLGEAEQGYRKALGIAVRLKLEGEAAAGYHQLGNVALRRGRLDEAQQWYQKALGLSVRLGLQGRVAAGYHQLGNVAVRRGRLDEAQQWYQKALEILERVGHPPQAVKTLATIGSLRLAQARPREAVAWVGRAFTIATEYEMPVVREVSADLARLLQAMGEAEFTAAWRREAFPGQEPPLDLLRQVLEATPTAPRPG